jgi:hypothetical protein
MPTPMAKGEKSSDRRDQKWGNVLLLLVPVLVIVWLVLDPDENTAPEVTADAQTAAVSPLTDSDSQAIANFVSAAWRGEDPPAELPARFTEPARAVYVAVRSGSKRRASLWKTEGSVHDALLSAIAEARRRVGSKADEIDTIELGLSHSYRKLDPVEHEKQLKANIHRGVRGLELRLGDKMRRHSPTYTVASNRGNGRLIDLFQQEHSLSDEQLKTEVEYRTFEADQVLVTLGDPPKAHVLVRGNEVVGVDEVTQENVRRLANLLTQWLVANVHDDGRMTYMYWPSVTKEAPNKNNMIRQWMATNALNKAAMDGEDQALWDLVERNLDYNVDKFYKDGHEGIGVIDFSGKAKLGSAALAAMAMVEHPKRDKWAQQETRLRKGIETLWNEDGSFTTFFFPPGRTDQQNYYPGETLLFWATLYAMGKDEGLHHKFMKSFEYYQRWHLEPKNRNPAFVPWHTQAYFLMWEQTKDEELAKFIFEMNDWLVEQMQQWEGEVEYPDALGRFHNPEKRYGPPHASSTGVYLEGLIDAFKLARALGDTERQERYRVSIVRGLRSVMQLQYVDDIDMYYIAEKDRPYVLGGVRTTVYNNIIRCDNVQHNLMGILKILREFEASDFSHP